MIRSKKLAVFAASSVMAVFASNATAATVNFDLSSNGSFDLSGGETSFDFGDFTVSSSATNVASAITQNSNGLGVNIGGTDNQVVDGSGEDEFLTFAFDFAVTLTQIDFRFFEANDEFVLSFDGGAGTAGTADPWNGSQLTSLFSIAALGFDDDFRVKSISYEISAVPLPAGALLLLTGLAGLGLSQRRK